MVSGAYSSASLPPRLDLRPALPLRSRVEAPCERPSSSPCANAKPVSVPRSTSSAASSAVGPGNVRAAITLRPSRLGSPFRVSTSAGLVLSADATPCARSIRTRSCSRKSRPHKKSRVQAYRRVRGRHRARSRRRAVDSGQPRDASSRAHRTRPPRSRAAATQLVRTGPSVKTSPAAEA